MNFYFLNEFVFSQKYRFLRHVAFWIIHTVLVSILWYNNNNDVEQNLVKGFLWLPVRMLYCYPLIYWVLPQFLLNGKYIRFCFMILLWGIAGWLLNYAFRRFVFIPVQDYIGFEPVMREFWHPTSFLVLTTTAGITSVIVLFKHWLRKQQEWMQAEKDKVTAELQLLKAQVHPHFLFNTLNNIYSFSLENSPKTPGLLLKLSSLLSYMLYDCKEEEVPLEKEIEVMKNYIDLEKERYGDRIEISWSIEGAVRDKYVAPLLLLPFLENAFKHGMSEQLDRPWLSVDLVVINEKMNCKIVNSKNNLEVVNGKKGIGIENVKRRLAFLYPDQHELRIIDENNFFVISLLIDLKKKEMQQVPSGFSFIPVAKKVSL